MSSKNIVLRKTFPRVIKTEDKRRGMVRYIVDTRKNGKGERLFFEREKDAVARAKELAQELPVDRDSITLFFQASYEQWHTSAPTNSLDSLKH